MRNVVNLSTTTVLVATILQSAALSGQSPTTRDGVQAFLAGDYRRAQEILRPLAEDARQPDPLAQFFLAILYENSPDLAQSQFQACRLYSAVALTPNPLADQAAALNRYYQFPADFCTPLTADDYRNWPAGNFELAPNHHVVVNRDGMTISYRDSRKTVGFLDGRHGWVYLPLIYTRLSATRPQPVLRHFIQLFWWEPNEKSAGAWSLVWSLSEVQGLDLAWRTMQLVTTQIGPPSPSYNVSTLVNLRTNADGDVQWEIPSQQLRGIVPVSR